MDKFREVGGILCTRGASLRTKGAVYKGITLQRVDVWGINFGYDGKCFRGCEP